MPSSLSSFLELILQHPVLGLTGLGWGVFLLCIFITGKVLGWGKLVGSAALVISLFCVTQVFNTTIGPGYQSLVALIDQGAKAAPAAENKLQAVAGGELAGPKATKTKPASPAGQAPAASAKP